MNLIELIIWSFSATLSIGFGIGGYQMLGVLGAVGGVIIGLLCGLITGTSVAKIFFRNPRQNIKKGAKKRSDL